MHQTKKRLWSKTLKRFCLRKSKDPTAVFLFLFLPCFWQLSVHNFQRERGYAPNGNQVIVLSQLAKVLSNFLYLAIEQSTSLAKMRIFHTLQFLWYKASWAFGEGDKLKNLQDKLSCTIEFCTLEYTRVREVAISVSKKQYQNIRTVPKVLSPLLWSRVVSRTVKSVSSCWMV